MTSMSPHAEILELVSRANVHLDKEDWDAYARLFAAKAVLVTPSGQAARGRAEVRRLVEAQTPRERQHINVQINIAVEGDRASVTSYQLVLENAREPGVLQARFCVDHLQKTGRYWRFTSRRLFEQQRATSLVA
jgi:ketosteroid isomerase-like protein